MKKIVCLAVLALVAVALVVRPRVAVPKARTPVLVGRSAQNFAISLSACQSFVAAARIPTRADIRNSLVLH